MIVKIPVQELRPGMRLTNPGLSRESNPSLFLVDCEVKSQEQIDSAIGQGFRDCFIDTEQGEYFRVHRYEKARFETPFTEVSTDNPYGVHIGAHFDDIASKAREAEKCYRGLLEYSRGFTRRLAETRNIDLGEAGDFVGSVVEHASSLGDALLFLAKLQHYDDYSYTHNINVALIAVLFGRFIGLGQENLLVLGLSGLFHDIGKMMLPARILKKPGRLTQAEYAEVRRHPTHGRDMLLGQRGVHDEVVRAAWEHHEHFSGTGYPRGLAHEKIGRASSVLSIVDTFDALTTERCYSRAVHAHKAMSVIFNLRGSSFSPALVDRFVKYMGVYPVGSIVSLSTGEKAIVVAQNQDSLLLPRVRAVLDAGNRYIPPRDVDLLEAGPDGPRIVECLNPGECRVKARDFLDLGEDRPDQRPTMAAQAW